MMDSPSTTNNIDKLIKRVVKESGKTKNEIKELMEKRKEATHGLLSDYGALYAVAREFGISLDESKEIPLSKISEISPQKPYSIAARVKTIFPSRDFKRKDGSSGKFASLILLDDTGECRLVLWNNSADLVKKLSKGDVLMIRNAYGKESLDGGVELHAGSLTHITINPPNLDANSLPEVKEELKKVKDLSVDEKEVNLLCRVSSYFPPMEFTREDGSTGIRASFIGEDETGEIRVVLWGNNAKETIQRGDFVKIENAYTKEGLNQGLELQVGNLGRVIKIDDKKVIPSSLLKLPELKEEVEGGGEGEVLTINNIKANSSGFTTLGRVINVFSPRPYTNGTFASIILGDLTGTIRVVLWDDKSNIVNELKRGDAIKLKNVYAKTNLNQEPEIHVGKFGDISLDRESTLPPLEEVEKSLIKEKKIADLQVGDSYIKIKGKVVDIDTNRRLTYFTCSNCNTKIQNLGMGWYCDVCEEEVEPQPNLVLSFTIEDESGSIRVVSFREDAEKILGMDLEEIMNLIGETQSEEAPLENVKEDVLNTEISLIGRARYSSFSDQLEFLVTEVLG
jgi:replication factor A1